MVTKKQEVTANNELKKEGVNVEEVEQVVEVEEAEEVEEEITQKK